MECFFGGTILGGMIFGGTSFGGMIFGGMIFGGTIFWWNDLSCYPNKAMPNLRKYSRM